MSNLIQIALIHERLSDGSHAYSARAEFNAADKDDAVILLQKITSVIDAHMPDEIASSHEVKQ